METQRPTVTREESPSSVELRNRRIEEMRQKIAAMDNCKLNCRLEFITGIFSDIFYLSALAMNNAEYDPERPPLSLLFMADDMTEELAAIHDEYYHRVFELENKKELMAVNS